MHSKVHPKLTQGFSSLNCANQVAILQSHCLFSAKFPLFVTIPLTWLSKKTLYRGGTKREFHTKTLEETRRSYSDCWRLILSLAELHCERMRTVDFVHHLLQWNRFRKESLCCQYGHGEQFQRTITLLMYIKECRYCFKIDLEKKCERIR